MDGAAGKKGDGAIKGGERRRHVRLPSLSKPVDPDALLELHGFGVAFGKKVILCEISFSVQETGSTVLLGPSGTGKSTLLRTLAGLSSATPSFRQWGGAFYRGDPLHDGEERPELVAQSAQLMMSSVVENVVFNLPERNQLTRLDQRDLAARLLERAGLRELCSKLDDSVVSLSLAQQRHLAILRQAAAGPRLLCVDEPTTGLGEEESMRLLQYIKEEATRRAMLVVLHNQRHARVLGGNAILMAGGYVQERQPIPQIFENPLSACGREFARNGTCTVASPGANPEELDESVPPPPPLPKAALQYAHSAGGPRGFLWLKRGRLAGTPVPGVYFDMEYDLKALKRVGVTTLISLTENPLDEERLTPFGIKAIWEPIPDMHAPTIEQGARICRRIDDLLAKNEVIAVHCRAGLGRTGTVLAAHMIWEGHSALDALEAVRSIEPRWVQSHAQVEFLEAFAEARSRNFQAAG
ncbi:MAG TPA: ATP-binding cassette domain-containing protein [Gallionellaceae bacterium]|nr:ATP-binding cassette domain-containing protein [Gallionellaceae bacterium]